MNEMRKLMESVEQLAESAGATVYIGLVDEPYQGLHTIKDWEATSDPQWAARQAEKIAENLGVEVIVVKWAGHFNKKSGYKKFELLLEKIKQCEDYA